MVSTTSGTTTFSLDVDDIIEQALEPIGGDYTNANDQAKARRQLNLILIELQNKNVPLDKIEISSISLVDGQKEYTMDGSISDVLEGSLKVVSDESESLLDRWSRQEYHQISKKNQDGRPTLFVIDRSRDGVKVTLWPTPDQTGKWSFEALAIKRIEDVTASYQKIDLPYRYFPLLVSWLSYRLSMTKPKVPEEVRNRLRLELDAIMMDTFEEDRERVDFTIIPGGISGR